MKNKVLVVVGIVLLAFAAYLVSQRMSPQEVPRAPAETAVQEVSPAPAEPATFAVEGRDAVQRQTHISSVAVPPDEPPDAKGKKERQMPLADLLERASAKWGFQFDDFYRYKEGREDWSIWEQTTNEYISDYLASEFHPDAVEIKTEHFRHRYKQLWEQGVALADVPTPAELEPDDGGYNIRMWDRKLGVYRRLDPTIYVDLSHMTLRRGGGKSYNQNAVRYVDGAPRLSDEDEHRLIDRGVHPEGAKVIYIDQNGQELPLGQRPKELDPAEIFKYMSDERLRQSARRWESALNMSPDQEKVFLKTIQDPIDRMITEEALFAFMSAWSERPSAWVPPVPSTGAAHGPPSGPLSPVNALPDSAASVEPGSRVPVAPPTSEPPSFEKPPMEPLSPDPPISARDLEGLLDAIKQETGEGLTDKERSILRLKELHDLYEAERRRRLRRDSD